MVFHDTHGLALAEGRVVVRAGSAALGAHPPMGPKRTRCGCAPVRMGRRVLLEKAAGHVVAEVERSGSDHVSSPGGVGLYTGSLGAAGAVPMERYSQNARSRSAESEPLEVFVPQVVGLEARASGMAVTLGYPGAYAGTRWEVYAVETARGGIRGLPRLGSPCTRWWSRAWCLPEHSETTWWDTREAGARVLPDTTRWAEADADSDGDGLSDGSERFRIQDPGSRRGTAMRMDSAMAKNSGCTGPIRLRIDSDGDRLSDGWEVRYGLNPVESGGQTEDWDQDGAENYKEYLFGSRSATPGQ